MGARKWEVGASTAFGWGEAPAGHLCLLSQARGPASNPRRASCGAGGTTPSTTSPPPLRGVDATAARPWLTTSIESYSIDTLDFYESCPSCACPVYDIDTRQGCLAA